jgi:hypothetical protein
MRVVSPGRQSAKATHSPIRNQISTRDQIKRVIDCHLCVVVVSYQNAVTDSSPFLPPRGDSSLVDLRLWLAAVAPFC